MVDLIYSSDLHGLLSIGQATKARRASMTITDSGCSCNAHAPDGQGASGLALG